MCEAFFAWGRSLRQWLCRPRLLTLLRSSLRLLPFAIEAEIADDDRDDRKGLGNTAADRAIDQIIGQPKRRAEKGPHTYSFGLLFSHGKGMRQRCYDGENFDQKMEIGRRYTENKKGKSVDAEGGNTHEDDNQGASRPGLLFSLCKDEISCNGDEIEQTAGKGAEHQKMNGPKAGRNGLHNNNALLRFLLKGDDTDGHCQQADGLSGDGEHDIPQII